MDKKWVLVGSVGKPYGVKGWVKINSYTEPLSNILIYQPWYLTKASKESCSIEIQRYQVHDQQVVVQFKNCQNPEAASQFTNRKIYVDREQFSPLGEGEYYWTDLEELKVYTRENLYLGIVQTLFSTGSNDVLIIEGKKRHLIPFLLDNTIKSIDLVGKTIIVDWNPDF